MAQTTLDPKPTINGVTQKPAAACESRGASAANPPARSPARKAETLPPSIDAFDELIEGDVTAFVNLSKELGGVVAEQVGCPSGRSGHLYIDACRSGLHGKLS